MYYWRRPLLDAQSSPVTYQAVGKQWNTKKRACCARSKDTKSLYEQMRHMVTIPIAERSAMGQAAHEKWCGSLISGMWCQLR